MTSDSNGTFRPLGDTDSRLHGATTLLVCGYTAADKKVLRDLLGVAGLSGLPLVFVSDATADKTISEIAAQDNGTGEDETSTLHRAIVMSGLAEKELHSVMKAHRESSLPQPIWAVVTPVSENWRLRKLLDELALERESLRAAVEKKGLAD